MPFEVQYTAKDEHIDFQGIMDGLYYPFYIEQCRHDFVKSVLGLDLMEMAAGGINMVLTKYTIEFKRPLKKGDTFNVTCSVHADSAGAPRIHFKQEITRDGKLVTTGLFSATCVRSSGGRAFIPEFVADVIGNNEPLTS